MATRIVFACAQATQNPICFSLIPELFRKDRTTAMAAYNSAIYMGRALSFAAVIVAGKLGMADPKGDIGVTMVKNPSLYNGKDHAALHRKSVHKALPAQFICKNSKMFGRPAFVAWGSINGNTYDNEDGASG